MSALLAPEPVRPVSNGGSFVVPGSTSTHSNHSWNSHSQGRFPRSRSPSRSRPRTPQYAASKKKPARRHRGLSAISARHGLQKTDAYIGLSFRMIGQDDPRFEEYLRDESGISSPYECKPTEKLLTWGAIISDGVGTVDSGSDSMIVETGHGELVGLDGWVEVKRVTERLARDTILIARGKSLVFQVVAISEPLPALLKNCPSFLPALWQHLNAIPFLVPSPVMMFSELPDPSPEYYASTAVGQAIKHLHPAIHSAIRIPIEDTTHRVQVDLDGMIITASIEGYRQCSSPALWKRFMALVRHVRGNDIKSVRCSATPQGGGVALLQHALIRLYRCVGLEKHAMWLVPEGHVAVFDITKKKFHNVLQGVAHPDVHLEDIDKRYFELWSKANYDHFWDKSGVFDDRIIVIDDPQLTAIIPLIKETRPDATIIFRSHIQIQSDLTDKVNTEQNHVWNYIFNFVKHTDLFLAHPVDFFVPQNVKDALPVLYMPPATDPLDGLNKPLGAAAVSQLREVHNYFSAMQCGVTIDWERGYVLQVARFDPSKGLPDLVESYLKFRQRLEDEGLGTDPSGKKPPMLIIVGHGSVDDPDGTSQYEMLHEIVNSEKYQLVTQDISIVRAPPSDTLLGMLMQGAWCATQLSTREGFEVKVSEAVLKRIPIIATKAGGIPLQVKEGINGWLVPVSDSDAVSQVLFEFYLGERRLNRGLRPDIRQQLEEELRHPSRADRHGGKMGEFESPCRSPLPEGQERKVLKLRGGTIGYGEGSRNTVPSGTVSSSSFDTPSDSGLKKVADAITINIEDTTGFNKSKSESESQSESKTKTKMYADTDHDAASVCSSDSNSDVDLSQIHIKSNRKSKTDKGADSKPINLKPKHKHRHHHHHHHSPGHDGGVPIDPNALADDFVRRAGAPFPVVHPDSAAPSEDFFTVGNAARWLLLFSLLSGKPIKQEHHARFRVDRNEGTPEEEVRLLESMGLSQEGGIGGKAAMEKINMANVWQMVMGEDMLEGDGRVIWRDAM